MKAEERALVIELLTDRIRWLRAQIRAQEALSEPCPPGTWRWADTTLDGYRRKSEEELADDRAQARIRAARFRVELDTAAAAYDTVKAGS